MTGATARSAAPWPASWPSAGSSRPQTEATALALGIHEDTGSLTYPSTTLRDVEALAFCTRHGANQELVGASCTRRWTTITARCWAT